MSAPVRVKVWSNVKMVTLHGAVVPVPVGDPVLLFGTADSTTSGVPIVTLDDGRQLLIKASDLEVLP